jgi:drug/metabolite transporter (DMT)-like permease
MTTLPSDPAAEAENITPIVTEPPQHASLTTSYLTLAGGVICIGFSGVFVRLAEGATGDVVTAYRLTIAALAMSIPALINWRRGGARLPLRALPLALLAGMFFTGDSTVWSTAVNLTTIANATLLGNTAPLWIGLAAVLIFREKLGRGYWLGLIVAMAGVVTIIGADALRGLSTNPGNLLALVSGACYACYQMVTQQGRAKIDTLTYSLVFTAAGALFSTILSLSLGHPLTGYPRDTLLALLGLGLISHMGGWLLINYSFGRMRASVVSVTLLAQPIVTAVLGVIFFSEIPGISEIVGGMITLVGIYLVHRSMAA